MKGRNDRVSASRVSRRSSGAGHFWKGGDVESEAMPLYVSGLLLGLGLGMMLTATLLTDYPAAKHPTAPLLVMFFGLACALVSLAAWF